MCKADWICNDSIRHEWCSGILIRFDTRSPTSRKQLCYSLSLFLDFTRLECFQAWNEARILDHILHKSAAAIKRILQRTAINSAGSPPIEKNSRPADWTKVLNMPWVAILTRWPYFCNSFPIATKGCTSPRLPTTWITILSGRFHGDASKYAGGAVLSISPGISTNFEILRANVESRSISTLPSSVWMSLSPSNAKNHTRYSRHAVLCK